MPRRPNVPPELTKKPFSLSEARAYGLTSEALSGKSWRRIGSQLYCYAGLREDAWHVLVAWRARLPPNAVFTGFSAAWLYHLDVDPIHPIEVAVGPKSGIRSRPGLIVRHRALSASDVRSVRGLRATTVARTLRDLKKRLPPLEHLVLADAALKLGLGRHHDLAEPAESPMETRLRWLLMESGLPRPQVQVDLHNSSGRLIGRADLYYPQARLVIEYDGANHRDRMTEDLRRQNAILSAGYRLLRFSAADLNQRPGEVVAQISRMLRTNSIFGGMVGAGLGR